MQSLRAILVGIALVTGITFTAVSSAQVKNTSSAPAKSCCSSECHKTDKNGQALGGHGDHREAKTVECSMDGPDCCKHGAKAEHMASAHAGASDEGHSCCGADCCCKEGECAMMQHATSSTQNEKTDSCCAGCECCKDQSCCTSASKDEK